MFSINTTQTVGLPNTRATGNVLYHKEVVVSSFLQKNEELVSLKIISIPHYSLYFDVIEHSEDGHGTVMIEKGISNTNKYCNFYECVSRIKSVKEFINFTMTSCCSLLVSLKRLHTLKIVYADIAYDTILYMTHSNSPIITRLERAIYVPNVSNHAYLQLTTKNVTFENKPIECFVLFYLSLNTFDSFTEELAEMIITKYIENLDILREFGATYKNAYLEKCRLFLGQYIGVSIAEIIQRMISFIEKWSIFNISMFYLEIVCMLRKTLKREHNAFLKHLLQIYTTNINPDPNKRFSITQTYQYCCNFSNVSFDFKQLTKQVTNDQFELLFKQPFLMMAS